MSSSPSSSIYTTDGAEEWMASFSCRYSSSTETISELSKSIDLDFDPPQSRKPSQASKVGGNFTPQLSGNLQARFIPPPLKLTPESEEKEESLLFDEDRLPTPASPFFFGPRHQPQRSDDSYCSTAMSGSVASFRLLFPPFKVENRRVFRARFSTFSIDNSCFDLGAMSGEHSLVGTPVEKVT